METIKRIFGKARLSVVSQLDGDWLEMNYSNHLGFCLKCTISEAPIYIYNLYPFPFYPFPMSTGTCCTQSVAGKLSHDWGSLSPSESKEILYQSNLLHSFGDFSHFFKNIWHCNCSSDQNEEMSEVSSAVTSTTLTKHQLSWLLAVPVVKISMKELLYSNFPASHKFMCSFIYFSFMHWAGVSQQLLHQDSGSERMAANQGLQISPLWIRSKISRWTSQRQKYL